MQWAEAAQRQSEGGTERNGGCTRGGERKSQVDSPAVGEMTVAVAVGWELSVGVAVRWLCRAGGSAAALTLHGCMDACATPRKGCVSTVTVCTARQRRGGARGWMRDE